MNKVNIGLLGMGNIGTGTYKTCIMNHEHIKKVTGIDFEVIKILEIDTDRDRGISVDKSIFTQDIDDILNDPEIHIVIELLGGLEPATDFMLKAMEKGKHVVTANKAAVAAEYDKLEKTARDNKIMFRFEASVGGGIPILNALTTALLANEYKEITGILNGTTNYILSKMRSEGRPYDEILKEAQKKGFAEADPTADVEGEDVANKLSILMSLIFNKRILPKDIPTRGITHISNEDIKTAEEEGCVIKLVATAFSTADGEVDCYIQPTLLNKEHPLAGVENEFNAIFVRGNAVDELMFYGKGAGPMPTGSAVMGDVIEIGKAIKKGTAFDI